MSPQLDSQQKLRPRQRIYRALKWAAILLIALSMAEFVALDMATVIATDAVFYLELIVAGWVMAALAFLSPALGYKLILFGSRIFQGQREQPAKTPDDL